MVDDEPDIEDMVRVRLRREIRSGKYRFTFASDGEEALSALAKEPSIEIIVTDINMPRMNGLELLHNLAEHLPHMKAIVVSAYGDLKNIRAAMNQGAFDFVTKPLDFTDLETTIKKTNDHIIHQKSLEENRDRLKDLNGQLILAANIQNSILPTTFPQNNQMDTHGAMRPAQNVSGDFFDIFTLPDGRIALSIADVADKGIPAALYMMATQSILKATATTVTDPPKVLTEVNNLLSQDNRATMFVTLIYAVYNPLTGMLTYANGGHCNPALVGPGGATITLPTTGGVCLALQPDLHYREHTMEIPKDHTFVAFTDGVTEAQDPQGNQLGTEAMQRFFAESPPESAKDAVTQVMEAVAAFANGADPHDDATCIALHRT